MEKDFNVTPDGQESNVVNPDTQEKSIEELQAEIERINRDYKHLQKAYTKGQQKIKNLEPDLQYIEILKNNPELLVQVDDLVKGYNKGYVSRTPTINQSDMKEALLYLFKQPDYDKYRDDIEMYAEQEGYDAENPIELKKAYFLWRGANIDRIITDKTKSDMSKKDAESKKKQSVPPIQGSGTIKTPPPDYSKMSVKQILEEEGLKLFDD